MKFSLFHEELFFANFFIVSLKELFKESVNRPETSISPFSVFVILSLLSGKKFPPWNRHKYIYSILQMLTTHALLLMTTVIIVTVTE